MFCSHIFLCTTDMAGAGRSQNRVSDSLELEIQTVVSFHVGAGMKLWSFGRMTYALNHRTLSPSPRTLKKVT